MTDLSLELVLVTGQIINDYLDKAAYELFMYKREIKECIDDNKNDIHITLTRRTILFSFFLFEFVNIPISQKR